MNIAFFKSRMVISHTIITQFSIAVESIKTYVTIVYMVCNFRVLKIDVEWSIGLNNQILLTLICCLCFKFKLPQHCVLISFLKYEEL